MLNWFALATFGLVSTTLHPQLTLSWHCLLCMRLAATLVVFNFFVLNFLYEVDNYATKNLNFDIYQNDEGEKYILSGISDRKASPAKSTSKSQAGLALTQEGPYHPHSQETTSNSSSSTPASLQGQNLPSTHCSRSSSNVAGYSKPDFAETSYLEMCLVSTACQRHSGMVSRMLRTLVRGLRCCLQSSGATKYSIHGNILGLAEASTCTTPEKHFERASTNEGRFAEQDLANALCQADCLHAKQSQLRYQLCWTEPLCSTMEDAGKQGRTGLKYWSQSGTHECPEERDRKSVV